MGSFKHNYISLVLSFPRLLYSVLSPVLIKKTGKWSNFCALSLSSAISVLLTLQSSWPFLSSLWVMGSNLSSLLTPFSPSFSLYFFPPPSLSELPIKKQGPWWQEPCWCEWLDEQQPVPGPQCESEARPSPLIFTHFPVSNKSFSRQLEPLWPGQSRNSTLSAADIKASFAVKH